MSTSSASISYYRIILQPKDLKKHGFCVLNYLSSKLPRRSFNWSSIFIYLSNLIWYTQIYGVHLSWLLTLACKLLDFLMISWQEASCMRCLHSLLVDPYVSLHWGQLSWLVHSMIYQPYVSPCSVLIIHTLNYRNPNLILLYSGSSKRQASHYDALVFENSLHWCHSSEILVSTMRWLAAWELSKFSWACCLFQSWCIVIGLLLHFSSWSWDPAILLSREGLRPSFDSENYHYWCHHPTVYINSLASYLSFFENLLLKKTPNYSCLVCHNMSGLLDLSKFTSNSYQYRLAICSGSTRIRVCLKQSHDLAW